MRLIILLGPLLLAGCCNIVGPVENYRNFQRPDNPCLSIAEQEKRARAQMSMPEFHNSVAPPLGIDFPGPTGR